MSATPKVDLFERFKRLYGLTDGLTPEAADDVQAVLDAEPDDAAEEALELLSRLRAYMLPSGRMPVYRELAERMRGLANPTAIWSALQEFERDLIALGGAPDPELAGAVEVLECAFPGARLVEVKRIH